MKIGPSSPIQPIWPNTVKREREADPTFLPQPDEAKQALRNMVQRKISEMEEARKNMGDHDPHAQLLIDKFKSGKKLSTEEMNYIRKNAPGMVDYIERTTREREAIELAMKAAPTKADVHLVALSAAKQIENDPNPEERAIRAKHLAEAQHEYMQTEDYKQKPNGPLDEGVQSNHLKQKKMTTQYGHVYQALQAYEQIKNQRK